jgi:hypothetical protein
MKNSYTFFNLTSKIHLKSGLSFFFITLLLSLVIFVVGIGSVLGQAVSTYTPLITSGTYSAITGTSILGNVDDGNSNAINIGFTFNLGGQNFTQFVANSNGHIRLGATATTSSYSPLSTTTNTYSISAVARDGKSTGGVIHTVSGTAPNRISIIQYTNYDLVYNATTRRVSFQIRLYETTNVVEIIYTGAVGNTTTQTVQVGLRGSTTTADVRNYSGSNSGWSALTAGTTSTSTIPWGSSQTTTRSMPSNGRILRWSPPPPAQPSVISGILDAEPGTSQTYSVTNVSGVTYTWSFPPTWTITGGQGTNTVTVTAGTQNGSISVTPSNTSGNGTARTSATTIPNYRWKYVSSNLGSSVWTGGEARNVNITIKNTGVATWNTTYPNNVGVRWNSTTGSLSGTPWSDFHSRTSVGNLAPGATNTFTLPIQAKNATGGPTYGSNLADGTYYLAFDLVSEGQCWFNNNSGTCGPGNVVFYSAAQTISSTPTISTVGTLSQFGSCVNTASSGQSFSVSAVNLSTNLVITAPTGYQVSLSAGSGFGASVSIAPTSGTVASTTIFARMAAAGSPPAAGNIACTSTGATTVNVAVSGTQSAVTTNQGTVTGAAVQSVCAEQGVTFTAGGSPSVNFGSLQYRWYLGHDVGAGFTDWQYLGDSPSLTNYVPRTLPIFANSSRFLFVRRVVSSCGTECVPDCGSQDNYREVNVIPSPTVNAGADFNMCSGQTVTMNASANAVGPTLSGTANSGTVTVSGTDNTNPTATYTFTGLPAGALISGITVNITSAGGGNCPSWYSVTTRLNGVQQGVAGCATNTTYTNLNGQAANGLVVAVRGQDNDAYADNMTITYTVTLNYTYVGNPTYAWTPSTGLSATNVLNPNCSATSSQTYTLTVTGGNGCSTSDVVVVTVAGSAPVAPAASATTPEINVGGTASLSATGTNITWYNAPTAGSVLGTGTSYTSDVQCTPSTVTVYAEDDNGTCVSATRTPVTFTVRPMVVSNPANGLICQAGGSVTLSAQLTGGSAITWSPNTNLSTTSGASTVASPTITTPYTMSATVAGCGFVSGTQTVGVIDAVAFTPTSTPTAVCAGNTALLASNLNASNFSVGLTSSFSPISPPGSGVTILLNGATAQAATLSGGDYDDGGWGGIPIGFSYNFFGQNFSTLAVGTNGLVMFGAVPGYGTASGQLGQFSFNTTGGAFPNINNPGNIIALLAHDINMNNFNASTIVRYWTQGIAPTRKFVLDFVSVPTFATPATFSTAQLVLNETTGVVEIYVTSAPAGTGNSAKIIGLQNGDKSIGAVAGPNNSTPEWNYRTTVASNLGYKFVPGADYSFQWATAGSNIGGATATTFTTPALNTPGTVSYSVAATNPNTNCTTTQSVNITVNALPSAPVSSGNVTECANAANQNLVVSVGAGETADWYDVTTAGSVLASGANTTSFSVPANATVTRYAQAKNTTTGCTSSSRTALTFTTKPVPTAPSASAVSYCQGATSSPMTASTPVGSNTQNWYDVSTGGTPLAGAPTPSTATATTLTYYVSEVGANGCESNRTSVTATISATPSAPSASNPSAYCQNAGASALTATAGVGNTLYWYTVPTGGSGSTTAITPSTSTAGNTNYYVAQRSASNCESSRATITVTVNPNITASVTNSASSTSACGGGAITFTATPTNGGASPTYQWYLNGVTVGTNSASYELASPANNDQIYVAMTPSAQTCLTSTAATNSNTVTLTSTTSTPTVAIQSSAIAAICPGTSVTFSVNSSANMGATPSYVWKLNGNPISGATNATYTSTGLVNNDQITLEMTSSLNGLCVTQPSATSSAITTTVNSATTITSQPSATSACVSGTANFTVTGAGQGTLTYQWKKNTVDITGNGTATSSTLTLSGVGAGDVADYTVVVTGACGSVTSNTAAFTLNTPTSISIHPEAVTTCTNTNANFNVTAAGQGSLSYQWTFNGSPINTATNSSYTASGVTSANAGSYRVIVTGGCGALTSNAAALSVQPATVISTQPTASTLCQNNTANFSVSATGQGTLSYQWKRDGTNVGTNSSSLAVSNAQSINAGSYTVDVTGGCGTTTSNAAVLTVNPATSITSQPVGTAGCEGQNTTFTVVAAGTGSLSYQWKYGATNVGTNSPSYNIPSTSNANDGNYSVVVTGGCGSVSSSTVALNVYPTPTVSAGDDITVCPGSPITLTGSGLESGTYSWNNSVQNGVQFNAPSTTTTYTLTGTTTNNCSNTDEITVNVRPAFSAGAINSSGQNICINTNASLIGNETSASGGDQNITYSWRSSADNFTGTISGETSATFDPPVLTSSTTYKRYARDGVCNTTPTQSTGEWVVTVSPVSVAGSLSGAATVCTGLNNTLMTLTGSTGSIQWQSSSDNVNYADIIGSTNSTYTAQNLTSTTYYRAVITSGACSPATSNNQSVLVNQPLIEISVDNAEIQVGDYLWNGLVSSDGSNEANWYVLGANGYVAASQAPTSSDQVFIVNYVNNNNCVSQSNNATIPESASFVANNTFIGTDASLVLANGSTLQVTGNFTNLGTFTPNNSTVEFTGSGDSFITMPSESKTFRNIQINKTGEGQVRLGSNIAVTGNVTFSSGRLRLEQKELDLGTTGNLVGESATSYAYCDCPSATIKATRTIGAGATVEAGTLGLSISPAVNMGTVVIERRHQRLPVPVYSSALDDYNQVNSIERSYLVKDPAGNTVQNNGSLNATIVFKYINDEGLNALSIYKRANSTEPWVEYGGLQNTENNTVTFTGWQSFSELTLGGFGSPLPVELLTFNASCQDLGNRLTWSTASENNSLHFEVQRSRDGSIWENIAEIPAAGFSNQLLSYEFTDFQMNSSLMYYRLNQVDINGDNKIYGPIAVDCENSSQNIAITFPNPSKSGFTMVISQKDLVGSAIVEIRDTKGAVVYTNAVNIEEGINQINFSEAFSPGIYYISVTNGKVKSKIVKHSVF